MQIEKLEKNKNEKRKENNLMRDEERVLNPSQFAQLVFVWE